MSMLTTEQETRDDDHQFLSKIKELRQKTPKKKIINTKKVRKIITT